jgi:hypothetical protein
MSVSRFDQNKVLKSPQDVVLLAERLAKRSEVTQFDDESSFREFLDEILPKLTSSEGDELYDLLLETAESFRHILYHILVQQKFFRYVAPTTDVSFQPPNRA